MNVVFRTDASKQIGAGHLMRCLSLAEFLHDHGGKVSFVCKSLQDDLYAEIRERNFPVHLMETRGNEMDALPGRVMGSSIKRDTLLAAWQQDAMATREWVRQVAADWVVLDHYGLDGAWEREVRNLGIRLLVIDDLANRQHDCDLLLDQNLHFNAHTRYVGKVSQSCGCLLGPQYALLRTQFARVRTTTQPRSGNLHRILLSFGGADISNETGKALCGIADLVRDWGVSVDVILGPLHSHRDKVEALARTIPGVQVHHRVSNMAELMARADLSFGAGGTTTWERCCVGLPAFVTVLAENQLMSTQTLHREGAVVHLGQASVLIPDDYRRSIESARPADLKKMSELAMNLVDGQGCRRVVERMSFLS